MDQLSNIQENANTLQLEGSLTIQRIEEIKQIIYDALLNNNGLIIDHSEAVEFDLAYLQLLYSAWKTAEKMNKKFIIGPHDSPEFIKLVKLSGYPEPLFISREI
ncbi:MAG: hypothetical protein ACM3Q2_03635 [Syntrophothermus sp.]